ncbi:MAG: STAS-like domain-containing protein [Betaproteobacteria bacterium]|nr:STAS-like domain-containing protein [Betaproteobacteria bacterium]
MIDKFAVQRRALRLAAQGVNGIAAVLSQEFGISRQAAGVRLKTIERSGLLASTGATRNKRYALVDLQAVEANYRRDGLREDIVWRELCAPVVAQFPENVRDIWRYGITEMVNNAIDHSGSPDVIVSMRRNALFTTAAVVDHGEGIFLKIQKALGLYDTREAILELAKGKLTTDPENHTGEGIFFSSRVFDLFDIRSGALHFMHDAGLSDVLIERPKDAAGTLVIMRVDNDSARTTQEVFDTFAAPEEYTFAKTIVPVKLAQYEGEKLVSRSQARRLTMRFERFQTVILDFDGVAEIGQAFADEVLRVFQNAHPNTKLIPTHMTPAVENMVERATSGR